MAEINQNYYKFEFPVLSDIQAAQLYELGFEAFEDRETVFDGYLPEILLNEEIVNSIKEISVFNTYQLIVQQNWNAIWESGFSPITVDEAIFVRATFHEAKNFKYDIQIDPKMAFGTGHHATTYMVLSEMLGLSLLDKSVMDFGCGSGILAIAAEKMGAAHIKAIDYDKWSVENSIENSQLNGCRKIEVVQGDSLVLEDVGYDVVLANITRDILLKNSSDILRILKKGGIAIYSGFIPSDVIKIKSHLLELGVTTLKLRMKEDWACLVWIKK